MTITVLTWTGEYILCSLLFPHMKAYEIYFKWLKYPPLALRAKLREVS
jgi:hypothetical protein